MADLTHDNLPNSPDNYFVPLNVSSIAAYIKKILGEDIDVRLFTSPVDLLDAISKKRPHIVALSHYMWNKHLDSQIGKYIKKQFPDIIIAMGGPEIRFENEGIKQFLKQNSFVDIYMVFEGEQPFLNFIKKIIENSTSQKINLQKKYFADGQVIKGCAYLFNDDLIYGGPDIISDLDVLPSPYLTGLLDEFLERDFVPVFESNRGCPYSCCYCNWGVSSLNKVRKFSIQRVFDEMEYVAMKNPNLYFWHFADANFGIFKRDVEIAKKIKEIKDRFPSLKKVSAISSKNNLENNIKISDIAGGKHLIAIQSFDPKVQKAIGRINIAEEKIPYLVEELRKRGIKEISTDILCGLPQETTKSYLQTLQKCFDFDFDLIRVYNIILLQGSRLESDSSREKFSLKTKFRLSQNAYGSYNGIKSIESEEMITGTSTMTEKELLRFRIIHWLIEFCWNSNIQKPLLKYLKFHHKISPLDLIINLIDHSKNKYPQVKNIFNQFMLEAENERFNSPEELREFYFEENRFNELLNCGFSKMNFKFTAMFILDRTLYLEFCDLLQEVATNLSSKKIPDNLFTLAKETIIDINDLFDNNVILEKNIEIDSDIAEFYLKRKLDDNEKLTTLKLYKTSEDISNVRNLLERYGYSKHHRLAVEKVLWFLISAFSYQIEKNKIDLNISYKHTNIV